MLGKLCSVLIRGRSLHLHFCMLVLLLSFTSKTNAQLSADFTFNPSQGCAPVTVQFTNNSSGNIASYLWDLGNGNKSTKKSPSAIYYSAGKYSIKLVVTDINGNKDSISKSNVITVFKGPTANLSVDKKLICVNETVSFTDGSTKGDGKIIYWKWDMGDGQLYTSENAKHDYLLGAKKHSISLLVRDDNGCESSLKLTDHIEVRKVPEAKFTIDKPAGCSTPHAVNFASTSPGASYDWDFDNGKTSTGKNASTSYNSLNTYLVKLTLTDAHGCKNTTSQKVEVNKFKADFTALKRESCMGAPLQFLDNSYPQTPGMKYKWEFGDGGTADKNFASHEFSKSGFLDVKLVIEFGNCKDSITKRNYVEIYPEPVVTFHYSDSFSCDTPFYVAFTNTTANSKNQEWHFGDTDTSIEKSITHKYSKIGSYTVSLDVTDEKGCIGTLEKPKLIKLHSLVADYTPDTPTRGCVPLKIERRDTSKSTVSLAKHYYDFGDGTTANTPNATHTYTKPGTYRMVYTVENSSGCIDSIVKEIDVGVKLKPNFYASKPEVCNGEPLFFYTTTPPNNPKIDSYSWSFGGTDRNQVYQYNVDQDSISVTLTLENNGCKSDTTIDNLIKVKGPALKITSNYDKCKTDTFYFANNSVNYDSFIWRYDGKTSNADTLFFYENEFTKNIYVTLTAWDFESGCVNSAFDTIIMNRKPIIQINHDSASCAPVDVEFRNNSSGIKSWSWVFDGDTILDEKPVFTFDNGGKQSVTFLATGNNKCPYSQIVDVVIPGVEINGSIAIPDNSCTPVTVTLYDSLYDPNIPKFWLMGNGDTLQQDSQKHTYVYYEPGPAAFNEEYTISLHSDDLGECKSSKSYKVKISGPSANIKHTGIIRCDKVAIDAWGTELKGVSPLSVEMEAEGEKSQKNYLSFYYTKSEPTPIYFKITDGNGCKSTIEKSIYYDPTFLQADLIADTSGSFCPPLPVNFSDKSVSPNAQIVSWFWDFGDGTTSNLRNPGKIYLHPGKYSVSLTVMDETGCTSKKTYPDLIGVEGPHGDYSFDLTESCTPATINFTSTTYSADEIKWDLGDGTVLSGNDQKHLYTRPGAYIPLLILKDSLGCKHILPPIDTIHIYPNPTIDFKVKNACVGEEVEFENHSSVEVGELDSFKWEFGDNNIGYSKNEIHSYAPPERYFKAKLIGITEFGCSDSTTKNVNLYGVNADFDSNKDTFCVGENLHFTNKSSADTSIASYYWNFGGTNSIEESPTHKLTTVGWHEISLLVTDVTGCTDSISIHDQILVGDTLPADLSELLRVSVVSDNSIDVKFRANEEVDFYRYELYRETSTESFTKIAETNLRKDTLLVDNSVVTLHRSHCFKVNTENICHYKLPLDSLKKHCTVEAGASPLVNSVKVEWSPYFGWNEVDTYFVYREVRGDIGNYQYLAKVSGNDTSYIDSSIYCDDELFYRIQAKEKLGNNQLSWSDTTGSRPIYINTVPPNEVWRISVEEDRFIHLEWLPSFGNRFPIEQYLIERSQDGLNFGLWESMDSSEFEHNDLRKLDVDARSYYYKMKAVDVCKDTSDYSNLSKSILLNVGINNDNRPSLSWSRYKGWAEGVEEYVVEIQELDGSFTELGRTAFDDTTFIDNTSETSCIPEYCYRITAIRNQPFNYPDSSHSAISHSNVMCAPVESKLYVPNAFTVNNDNLNESFVVKGVYIADYNIKIFNRWGEKIFDRSSCLDDHWDGTYKGQDCKQDVYIYIIEAMGADRKNYNLKGDITLLK
jgi:gliding motility-associated-like protein